MQTIQTYKEILKLSLSNPDKVTRLISIKCCSTEMKEIESLCSGLADHYFVINTKKAVVDSDSVKDKSATVSVDEISLDTKIISLDFSNCTTSRQRKFLVSLLNRIKYLGITVVTWNYNVADKELPSHLVDVYDVVEEPIGYVTSKCMQPSKSHGTLPAIYNDGFIVKVQHPTITHLATDEWLFDEPLIYAWLGYEYCANIFKYLFLEKLIKQIPRTDGLCVGELLMGARNTFIVYADSRTDATKVNSVISELKSKCHPDPIRVIILNSSSIFDYNAVFENSTLFGEEKRLVCTFITDPDRNYFSNVENRRRFLKPTDGSEHHQPYVGSDVIAADFKSFENFIDRFSKTYSVSINLVQLSDNVYAENKLTNSNISKLRNEACGIYFYDGDEKEMSLETTLEAFNKFIKHRRYSKPEKYYNFFIFYRAGIEFDFDNFVIGIKQNEYIINSINRYLAIDSAKDVEVERTYFNLVGSTLNGSDKQTVTCDEVESEIVDPYSWIDSRIVEGKVDLLKTRVGVDFLIGTLEHYSAGDTCGVTFHYLNLVGENTNLSRVARSVTMDVKYIGLYKLNLSDNIIIETPNDETKCWMVLASPTDKSLVFELPRNIFDELNFNLDDVRFVSK